MRGGLFNEGKEAGGGSNRIRCYISSLIDVTEDFWGT